MTRAALLLIIALIVGAADYWAAETTAQVVAETSQRSR